MIDMSFFELLAIVFGSGGISGLIVLLLTYKSKKRKEEAIAAQEEEKARAIDIKSTKDVIDLYKTGMKDLQELMMRREKELSAKVSDYAKKVEEYQKENKKLHDLVDQLRSTQLKLKSRLDTLTAQSLQDCNKCSFRDDCMKFKAKKLVVEEDEN